MMLVMMLNDNGDDDDSDLLILSTHRLTELFYIHFIICCNSLRLMTTKFLKVTYEPAIITV